MGYKIVKLPDLGIVECESGLMKFYEALGYDKESEYLLRPMDILLNKDDHLEILQRFKKSFADNKGYLSKDDEIGISFLFMNNGPSSDEGIEKGTVKLVDGWNRGIWKMSNYIV